MEESRLSTTEDDSMVEATSPESPSSSASSSLANHQHDEEETLNNNSSPNTSKSSSNNNRNSVSLPLLHIASPNAPLNLIYSCGKNKYGILGQLDDYSEKPVPTVTPIHYNSS